MARELQVIQDFYDLSLYLSQRILKFPRNIRYGGYRTWPSHRRLPATAVRAFLRRVRWMKRAYAERRVAGTEIHPRLMSWLGHAGQADTFRLVRRLSKAWVFRRAPA